MSKLNLEAIRVRAEAPRLWLSPNPQTEPLKRDVLALLDALAEAEADRDRWKARAEKLAQGSTERYWQQIDGGREA